MHDTSIQPVYDLHYGASLSAEDKEVRQKFVSEFIFDHNAIAACLRIGFVQPYASEFAKRFMNEPYVQQLIRVATTSAPKDEATSFEETKRTISAWLMREANYHGGDSSHGARVQALGKLVTIHGMEKKAEQTVNHKHTGGVLLIPAQPRQPKEIEEWEATVVKEQDALLHDRDSD